MIYAIISKNDVPTTQMHIYLTNKTGSDGGMIPELFTDLSAAESVNGLYAFAIGFILAYVTVKTGKIRYAIIKIFTFLLVTEST